MAVACIPVYWTYKKMAVVHARSFSVALFLPGLFAGLPLIITALPCNILKLLKSHQATWAKNLHLIIYCYLLLLLGSGASCIYPLLGAKLNNWHFLATEVDGSSVSYAKENVKHNGLESYISGEGNIHIIILLSLKKCLFIHNFSDMFRCCFIFTNR